MDKSFTVPLLPLLLVVCLVLLAGLTIGTLIGSVADELDHEQPLNSDNHHRPAAQSVPIEPAAEGTGS